MHPEAVLLAIVADSDVAVRAQAVGEIWRCRQEPQELGRSFRLPIINFSATHYTELLEWEKEPITELPLTTDLTDAAEIQGIGT